MVLKVRSVFSIPVEDLFAFHENAIGFQTLVGADPKVTVVTPPASLEKGAIAQMKVQILPGIHAHWISEHIDYQKNQLFVDQQTKGPFTSFCHYHEFFDKGACSELQDRIVLDFPFLPITRFFIGYQLKTLFQKRHLLTAQALGCEWKNLLVDFSSLNP